MIKINIFAIGYSMLICCAAVIQLHGWRTQNALFPQLFFFHSGASIHFCSFQLAT